LEESRACNLLALPPRETPVWTSGDSVLFHCPESLLDGETYYWLNLAELERSGLAVKSINMAALDYEALLVIENEWRKLYVNSRK
jgi:hypothetical protein